MRSAWQNLQDGFDELAACLSITDEERRALLLAAQVMRRADSSGVKLFARGQDHQDPDDIELLLRFVATNAKPSASSPPWKT